MLQCPPSHISCGCTRRKPPLGPSVQVTHWSRPAECALWCYLSGLVLVAHTAAVHMLGAVLCALLHPDGSQREQHIDPAVALDEQSWKMVARALPNVSFVLPRWASE